ncbi:hypothetical protein ACWGCW_00965 [Streptomyces sp. NPDC054933]
MNRLTGRPAGPRKAENDTERCLGVYGEKYKGDPAKIGTRCERRAVDGPYCRAHAEIPDEKRCRGHLTKHHPTNPGGRCTERAMEGLAVCYRHGGNAPQSRRAAERRINEAKVEAQMAKILAANGVAPVDNPLEALRELAGEARSLKDALGERVNDLKDDIRYESKAGGEQLRAEVALYERSLDRLGKLLVQIAALNLDERLVRIEEGKAAVIIDIIVATLDHAGISGPKAVDSREFAARRLEAVA